MCGDKHNLCQAMNVANIREYIVQRQLQVIASSALCSENTFLDNFGVL